VLVVEPASRLVHDRSLVRLQTVDKHAEKHSKLNRVTLVIAASIALFRLGVNGVLAPLHVVMVPRVALVLFRLLRVAMVLLVQHYWRIVTASSRHVHRIVKCHSGLTGARAIMNVALQTAHAIVLSQSRMHTMAHHATSTTWMRHKHAHSSHVLLTAK
jgi:hypothetical protein